MLGPGVEKWEEDLKMKLIELLPSNEPEIRHSDYIRRVTGLWCTIPPHTHTHTCPVFKNQLH